ncbi:MAG: hypothetical protein Q8K77_01540 [Thermodesulfovibrionales bacterium]|nr:hypothetical protein [Thermodesulfovibrionales bacterium]
MKKESSNALAWFAAILLFVGLLIMSPSGAFALFVLAALFAAFPAIFSQKKTRIIAAVLLLVSILLAVSRYPEFRSEQDRFSSRAKNTSTK